MSAGLPAGQGSEAAAPAAAAPAEVEVSVPAAPEYVGVARLAVLGVASRMRFDYDEVEDIRLAVGEACARCVDGSPGDLRRLRLRCLVEPERLTIEVCGPAAPPPAPAADAALGADMGGILIRMLMDEMENLPPPEPGLRALRLVKRVAR